MYSGGNCNLNLVFAVQWFQVMADAEVIVKFFTSVYELSMNLMLIN